MIDMVTNRGFGWKVNRIIDLYNYLDIFKNLGAKCTYIITQTGKVHFSH